MKCFCGAEMKEAGIGNYPYECIAKDKYPYHMIYQGCENGHTCWSHAPARFSVLNRKLGITTPQGAVHTFYELRQVLSPRVAAYMTILAHSSDIREARARLQSIGCIKA